MSRSVNIVQVREHDIIIISSINVFHYACLPHYTLPTVVRILYFAAFGELQ